MAGNDCQLTEQSRLMLLHWSCLHRGPGLSSSQEKLQQAWSRRHDSSSPLTTVNRSGIFPAGSETHSHQPHRTREQSSNIMLTSKHSSYTGIECQSIMKTYVLYLVSAKHSTRTNVNAYLHGDNRNFHTYLTAEMNLHKFSKSAAVVVPHCLGIAKRLQQWICYKNVM